MASAADFMLSLNQASKVVEDGVKVMDSLLVHEKKKRSDIIPFHCNLAPSFGTLTNEAFKLMDEKLKVMIGGTTMIMAKLLQEAQTNNHPVEWEQIVQTMATNPFLEPMGDVIHRSDKIIEEHDNVFKFDGSAEPAIVRKVESWFTSLINDDDVLRDTKIDIHVLGKIVAETGARVEDFVTLFYKKTSVESKVMDIGILRYPDIERPYFKVYRIQLTAWSDCERILMHQHDSNGITGVYHCRKYKPRDSVIRDIAAETVKKSVQLADELFANF